MEGTPLQRRFIGQSQLVRMLLWKIGESTDIEIGLTVAHAGRMLSDDDVIFASRCLAVEELHRVTGQFNIEITEDAVTHLQRLADKLNRADAA